MEKLMTCREMAMVAGVNIRTIQKLAKRLFPNKIRTNGKTTYYNKEECNKIIEEVRKKNLVSNSENFSLINENLSLLIKTIIKETILELKNEIISELKINQKSLPKPDHQEDHININFEYLYPSRIAKYLECKTKYIFDALYQMQMISLNKWNGKYQITEKGEKIETKRN